MKKLVCWLLLASLLLLCACSKGEKSVDVTDASGNGTPLDLGDDVSLNDRIESESDEATEDALKVSFPEHLPAGYTEEQALQDGCLVLSWPFGEIKPNISGVEHWENFLKAVEDGADEARIRAVYFQNGIYYYTDLTYIDGYFSMYTLNEFQNYEKAVGTYPYIKHIEGIEPNTGNEVSYYILSELEDLTSEDVLDAARICDIETERGVPYEPIPFTQYGFDTEE